MDKLMMQLAVFVTSQDCTDFIKVWNAWMDTGIHIPQESVPTLLAIVRELVLIDKETLKEVVRVGNKCKS